MSHYNRLQLDLEIPRSNPIARPNRGDRVFPLKTHLETVGQQGAAQARDRNLIQLAHLADIAGRLHDLGKYHPDWQQMIYAPEAWDGGRLRHAIQGAWWALEHGRSQPDTIDQIDQTELVAVFLAIAGHHTGLHNFSDIATRYRSDTELHQDIKRCEQAARKDGLDLPEMAGTMQPIDAYDLRMLFSLLVDADRLDASGQQSETRSRPSSSLAEIWQQWRSLPQDGTPLNTLRADFYDACLTAATQERGIYTLTGMTGIGKTRSMLAFALRHSLHHHLERIIYVAPFCSILEQNADVFRGLIGQQNTDALLEHHSGANIPCEDDREFFDYRSNILERWQHPIVCTSFVQFFESLFHRSPSRLRKLQALPNSVILLDEVQAIPSEFLDLALEAIEVLHRWGCTVILATATPHDLKFAGRQAIQDICPPNLLVLQQELLKRVTVNDRGNMTLEAIANDVQKRSEYSILIVVNTKPRAKQLTQLLADITSLKRRIFILTTWMCPQHRADQIDEIRRLIAAKEPIVVVSTQLIEAGVDLDFETGYREIAGWSSIVQTAGRINRNNLRPTASLTIFDTGNSLDTGNDRSLPPGYKQFIQAMKNTRDRFGFEIDNPEAAKWYSCCLQNADSKKLTKEIRAHHKKFEMQQASDKFKWIEEDTNPVVVPYGSGLEILKQLQTAQKEGARGQLLRRQLQRFCVQLKESELKKFEAVKLTDIEGLHRCDQYNTYGLTSCKE